MFDLRPVSKEAVPAALEKAQRYRLLGNPAVAESICLDVLDADTGNGEALVMLLLARTDQFDEDLLAAASRAREILPRLDDPYAKAYYEGLICERQGKAVLKQSGLRACHTAYNWLRQAMDLYQAAAKIRPPDNDESLLHWNTCVRFLERNPQLTPEPEDYGDGGVSHAFDS